MTCNTSAAQHFVSQVSRGQGNPVSIDQLESTGYGLSLANVSGPPMDITSVIPYWAAVERDVLELLGPVGSSSVLLQSLQESNLSSMKFSYEGNRFHFKNLC